MTPLVAFAQTTTYEFTPPSQRLPPFLWTGFTALNQIHGAWRWYRRIELYRNPDNLAQLLGGHIVNLVIGDMVLLRIAAQCLLISTRILECAQQQTALCLAGKRWMTAVKGHYPKPCRHSWNREHHSLWTSPSSKGSWQRQSAVFWDRIQRIVVCTAAIFIHLFKLSMKIMDAIDAFCLSPHTRNEGINEGIVNGMKWLDSLVENKEELLAGITANQAVIEKILRNSPITYTQLHQGVAKTLEKTEVAYHSAKKVSDFSNGILIELGKRILNGGMVMIGLSSYRPLVLVKKVMG